jgi:hypothetical protein
LFGYLAQNIQNRRNPNYIKTNFCFDFANFFLDFPDFRKNPGNSNIKQRNSNNNQRKSKKKQFFLLFGFRLYYVWISLLIVFCLDFAEFLLGFPRFLFGFPGLVKNNIFILIPHLAGLSSSPLGQSLDSV